MSPKGEVQVSMGQMAPGQFVISPGDEVELSAICRFKELRGETALFLLLNGEEFWVERTDIESGAVEFRTITECPWRLHDVVRDLDGNIFIWLGFWRCLTSTLANEPMGEVQLVKWDDGVVVSRG